MLESVVGKDFLPRGAGELCLELYQHIKTYII